MTRTHKRHSRALRRAAAFPRPRSARRAFTLIELLVSMTILVILASLVIVAFQPENDDRVSASARTLQSYLEGAKSRAISRQQPVGVRLITSQNDRRVVDSLQYVAANNELVGTLGSITYSSGRWIIANSLPGQWPQLNAGGRTLIQPGLRIEIPAGSGSWYRIGVIEDLNNNGVLDSNENDGTSSAPLDNSNGRLDFLISAGGSDWLSIRGHYQASILNPDAPYVPLYVAQPASGVPYRLKLASSTLPNSDPVQLERGIVVDLDASFLPGAWRPAAAKPYTATMDIMFDARGNPTGDLVAQGFINLYVTTLADVELTRNLITGHPANGGGAAWPIVPANPPTTPETEPRVVTLFTQTGQILRSQVNFTDKNAPPLIADDPYSYVRQGREAQ